MKATPLMVVLLTIMCPSPGPGPSRAEDSAVLWACVMPDGSMVYADRELSGKCRPLTRLPDVQQAPAMPGVPSVDAPPVPDEPPAADPPPRPRPGGGRRIDPPGDHAISIREVTAIPSYNSLLGLAYYEATMTLENVDSSWVAEKVCVNVRFRDRRRLFVDVREVGCMEDLRPFDPRPLTVRHTGMLPPRPGPIDAEAGVEFVKWTR